MSAGDEGLRALDYLVQMANGHDYADPMKMMDAEHEIRALLAETAPDVAVHNHPPYRPDCAERVLPSGRLRGACLPDPEPAPVADEGQAAGLSDQPYIGPRCYAHSDPSLHGEPVAAGRPAHVWGGPDATGCLRCPSPFQKGDRYLCDQGGIVHVECPTPALAARGATPASAVNDCGCLSCSTPWPRSPSGLPMARMVVCGTCGNKRCPRAANHANACSGSNELGQAGGATRGGDAS